MFMGEYQNSIDAKFRMIIPTKYRDELGYKCIVARGIDKCLEIHTPEEWQERVNKLSQLPSSDQNARVFIRNYLANAVECEIDRQGRMTIPQKLRQYAGIEKELYTLGCNDKLEVWSKEVYENSPELTNLTSEEVAEGLLKYGI